MKLGLMTAALPALSLEQLAAWASENGFEMLEIACWPPGQAERRYAGVMHIDVTEFDAAKAEEVHFALIQAISIIFSQVMGLS